MNLVSRDGEYAELRVMAYEFETPPVIAADDDDDDAGDEWLVVRGRVRLGDNREWAFTGPYLTITEARRLGAWLASAGAGRIAHSPASPPGRHLLCFTEPDLALSIAALSTERAAYACTSRTRACLPGTRTTTGPTTTPTSSSWISAQLT
jgi:hypothetical protein